MFCGVEARPSFPKPGRHAGLSGPTEFHGRFARSLEVHVKGSPGGHKIGLFACFCSRRTELLGFLLKPELSEPFDAPRVL